jgi:hypothetical protein
MLSGVNSSPLSDLLAGQNLSSSGQQPASAGDSFSRQVLSILEDSLAKLRASGASVQAVTTQDQASGAGGTSSSQCQFLVTFPAVGQQVADAQQTSVAQVAGKGQATAGTAAASMPEVLYEDHPSWRNTLYATQEAAAWLADRLGGEVGTYQFDWSPGFEPPPEGYTVKFGNKEVIAGHLAMYFEPGRFSQPDQEAALALFREGIANDYVREHRPELIEKYGLPAATVET